MIKVSIYSTIAVLLLGSCAVISNRNLNLNITEGIATSGYGSNSIDTIKVPERPTELNIKPPPPPSAPCKVKPRTVVPTPVQLDGGLLEAALTNNNNKVVVDLLIKNIEDLTKQLILAKSREKEYNKDLLRACM